MARQPIRETIGVQIVPGHELTGVWHLGEPGRPWRYGCSCGEIGGVTAAQAQEHVEELRSPAGANS